MAVIGTCSLCSGPAETPAIYGIRSSSAATRARGFLEIDEQFVGNYARARARETQTEYVGGGATTKGQPVRKFRTLVYVVVFISFVGRDHDRNSMVIKIVGPPSFKELNDDETSHLG